MRLVADGLRNPIALEWLGALTGMRIEHPNAESTVIVRLTNDPCIHLGLDHTRDTVTGVRRDRFAVASTRLVYFPGPALAREWLAAAWCGYMQHELLETVTYDGARVCDPHTPDYPHGPYNWTLRDGMPRELTPEALAKAMRVVCGG